MGINLVKRCYTNSMAVAPNPSPSHFSILELVEYDNAHVLKVKYHGCTNFEGEKIMVYLGPYIHNRLCLDPHFSEESDSPIARFRPDQKGWDAANAYAASI